MALDQATVQRGYYFQVGVDPTFAFANFPLTIELPTYVNFPSDNFYQNFAGKGSVSTLGLFTTELKGTGVRQLECLRGSPILLPDQPRLAGREPGPGDF